MKDSMKAFTFKLLIPILVFIPMQIYPMEKLKVVAKPYEPSFSAKHPYVFTSAVAALSGATAYGVASYFKEKINPWYVGAAGTLVGGIYGLTRKASFKVNKDFDIKVFLEVDEKDLKKNKQNRSIKEVPQKFAEGMELEEESSEHKFSLKKYNYFDASRKIASIVDDFVSPKTPDSKIGVLLSADKFDDVVRDCAFWFLSETDQIRLDKKKYLKRCKDIMDECHDDWRRYTKEGASTQVKGMPVDVRSIRGKCIIDFKVVKSLEEEYGVSLFRFSPSDWHKNKFHKKINAFFKNPEGTFDYSINIPLPVELYSKKDEIHAIVHALVDIQNEDEIDTQYLEMFKVMYELGPDSAFINNFIRTFGRVYFKCAKAAQLKRALKKNFPNVTLDLDIEFYFTSNKYN